MSDPVAALIALILSKPVGLLGAAKWFGGWVLVAAICLPFAVAAGILLDLAGALVVSAP